MWANKPEVHTGLVEDALIPKLQHLTSEVKVLNYTKEEIGSKDDFIEVYIEQHADTISRID